MTFKSLLIYLFYLPFTLAFRVQCAVQRGKVSIGKNLQICGFVHLKVNGELDIGDNVRINSCRFCNLADGGVTSFQVLKSGKLTIADGVGISNSAITCAEVINIGENVNIGANCAIVDTDFHSINYEERTRRRLINSTETVKTKPIHIESGVFLGMRSVILKGCRIESGSVIGAASVVVSSIPANVIAAGNPCLVKRVIGGKE